MKAFYGAVGAFILLLLICLGLAQLQISRLRTDRDNWKASAGKYQRSAGAWEASYRQDADRRASEVKAAIGAANAVALACAARGATARRSAAALQTIVTKEPIYDQAHCPVRRAVGIDLLRDATGLTPAS